MSTLELQIADDPAFQDNLFATKRFLAWLDTRVLTLPADPQITTYAYLQVYTLLAEIHSYARQTIAHEKALSILQKAGPSFIPSHLPAGRLIVADRVEEQWRTVLLEAVQAGELQLLDYASKLPTVLREEAEDYEGQERKRQEWEHSARAYAVEICRVEIAKGAEPTQEEVGKEVVVLLRNAAILTHKKKAISLAYVMKALQPWTAPSEATEEPEKKKIAGK